MVLNHGPNCMWISTFSDKNNVSASVYDFFVFGQNWIYLILPLALKNNPIYAITNSKKIKYNTVMFVYNVVVHT